jgi:hypothetical protein
MFLAIAIARVMNSIVISLVRYVSQIETGEISTKIQSRSLTKGKPTRGENIKIRLRE